MVVKDDTLNHHFCHCLALFFLAAMVTRQITLAETKGLIDSQFGFNFSLGCLGIALLYWVLWLISTIEEIAPKEQSNRFSSNQKPQIIHLGNLAEITYRALALLSIILGFIVGRI